MKKVLLILFSVLFVSCTTNDNYRNKFTIIITDIGITKSLLVYKTDKTNVDSLNNRLHELNMEFNKLEY